MKKLVFRFAKTHPLIVILAIVASLGSTFVIFAMAPILQYLVSTFTSGWNYVAFFVLIGYLFLFFGLFGANRYMQPCLNAKAGDYVRREYLAYLFQSDRLVEGEIGEELNDTLDNSDKAVSAYLLLPISLVSETLGLLMAAVYAAFIHYGLTIIGLGLGGLQLLSTFFFQRRLGQAGEEYSQATAEFRSQTEALLVSKDELQANRAGVFAKDQFVFKAKRAKDKSLFYYRCSVFQTVVSALLSMLGELLCLGLLGFLIIKGGADLGAMAAAIIILPSISDPVTTIAGDLAKMFGIVRIPVMKADLIVYDDIARPIKEFQGVKAKIDRNEASGLRLTAGFWLKPQEKILVLGDSGAGKTTLLRFLSGEVETEEGEVNFLNGAPASLSYCPQFPYCFKGSIKENIAFDDGDSKKISAICDEFGVKEDIPDPRQASGGEKKLIGLARAFYPESGLLLLDEPASSLGKQEEERVYEAILSYPWAVICAAHKPSLDVAGRFDRVYLIDQGKLFEATREQYARYCVD